MPAPHESPHDDRQLIHYLLGLLPDEETERIDELTIVDDDIAARLRGVENDLVDAYVRGTMPADDRARFEFVYLASPVRRRKVEFARGFLPLADRAVASVSPATPATLAPGRPFAGWALAAAAALLLTTGGALLVGELRLRNALADAHTTRAALDQRAIELERELLQQRTASADTASEVERLRADMAALTQRAPSSDTARIPTAASTMIALVLPPQTRSGAPVAAIAVPPSAQGVAFELQLDASDYPQYEATLQDSTSARVVWRSGKLTARAGELPSVSIVIPVALLPPQRHALQLVGYDSSGAPHPVGSYGFRVARR